MAHQIAKKLGSQVMFIIVCATAAGIGVAKLLDTVCNGMDDIVSWFDTTKLIAIASLCLAMVNSYFTWQNRRLNLRQEIRRRPNLTISLVKSYYYDDQNGLGRGYFINVVVRNPSDSANAIYEAELVVALLVENGEILRVKLNARDDRVRQLKSKPTDPLNLPTQISANQTVSGWLYFFLPKEMITGNAVSSYSLVLTDTHNQILQITPDLMSEYIYED